MGEAELVEAILQQRYTKKAEIPSDKTYRKDLKRFVELIENDPDKASLFTGFYIFQGTGNQTWHTPKGVYLDQPLIDTGLGVFYALAGEETSCKALSDNYRHCGVSVARLAEFAQAVGVQTYLQTTDASCSDNPDWRYLYAVSGERYTSPINRDYTIEGLDHALATPSLAISKLVWRTMGELPTKQLQALYRKNESGGCRFAPSQLVHTLRRHAWVPQGKEIFVRPAEANRDALPGGFPFDPDWEWIEAIEFGKELVERSQEQRRRQILARQLGFSDEESLDRAARFAALPVEEQHRILAQLETPIELPEREPSNPERRAARVAASAASAPERTTEERTRSVSINRDAVKEEAGQYLRQQYTNADGQMICQACKARLPFQLDDGNDYFERVEMLPDLKRHHKQNYLALCPNHAAMFMHANGSADELLERVKELTGNTLPIVLAQEEAMLYFTKTHLADLKVVIETDNEEVLETDT